MEDLERVLQKQSGGMGAGPAAGAAGDDGGAVARNGRWELVKILAYHI
jgi:hypothetical protein